jgi:hypothetical protein
MLRIMEKHQLRTRIVAFVAACAAVIGFNVVKSGSAHADEIIGVHIQDQNGGYCLDSNYSGDVYVNPCQSGNIYQQWNLYGSNQSGGWLISDQQTGRCLVWDGQKNYATTQPTCTQFGSWLQWSGNYGVMFENSNGRGCLDFGGYVAKGVCIASNSYQNWQFIYI